MSDPSRSDARCSDDGGIRSRDFALPLRRRDDDHRGPRPILRQIAEQFAYDQEHRLTQDQDGYPGGAAT